MPKKAFVATTALVLCVSTSFASQETRTPADANTQFVSWYGGWPAAGAAYRFAPRNGSKVLYEQSASSGFSAYAVSATNYYSDSGFCCWGNMAGDDFTIAGTGTHKITAVYAAGVNVSGYEPSSMAVTFYDKLKYSKKSGITAAVLKASCPRAPYSDLSGNGDMLVDVSSCNLGRFKGGHDYAVAVQGNAIYEGAWAWQTNRNQINRQAFYFTYGGESGSCTTQFTPIKTCLPRTGYGPDLAFAIIGK